MNRIPIVLSTTFSFFTLSITSLACAGSLAERFESEHAAAWKRLEDVYSKIELTEQMERSERSRNGQGPLIIKYFGDGARHRMDVETPETGTRVFVASPEKSFRLDRPNTQTEFVVKDVNQHAFDEIRNGMKGRGSLPFASYCIMDTRLIDFVSSPNFEKVGYDVIKVEGSELLKLSWRSPHTHEGESSTRVGWFLFIPDSWALQEYEFRYSEDAAGAVRARIEYEGNYDGVPLVKSIKQWTENRAGTIRPLMTSQLVQISTSPSNREKFTLEAFHLPNDLGAAVKPQTGRLWMILIGLAGLAVSWFLATWIRRRHASLS